MQVAGELARDCTGIRQSRSPNYFSRGLRGLRGWPADPRKVQVVEMRFFGGLSVEETAEVLQVSAGEDLLT